jgi:MarR family transcriptional regulator for hemolysin
MYQTIREFSKTRNQAIWGYGVYGSEWMMMNMIQHRGECSQAALIEYFGVEPPAISNALTKLEKKGIIVREVRPGSRGKFIRLTDKGQQICEQMSGVVARHRQQALMVLTVPERRHLETMMRKLYQNLLPENGES